MDKIQEFDDKILQLKQQKEQAELKLARALFKKVQMILGKDTDLSLITLMLEETWNNATSQQKENWRQQAATFRNPPRTKVSKDV